MTDILVLYFSRGGHTATLADHICRGIESVESCQARLRTVPGSDEAAPLVSAQDLRDCAALALGSPCYFGGMAAPLKAFWDSTTDLWLSGALVDKPAAVFTSSDSLHGGQESTLLAMALPLLHQGMMLLGLPYQHRGLHQSRGGGSPYGASHHAGGEDSVILQRHEAELAQSLGARLARTALALA